jgi:fructoselysine 3-epimerase
MPSIHPRQVAGMNIHYLYYSLDYFLDAQQQVGMQNIELWGGAPHFWLDHLSYSDCSAVCRKAQQRGLQIVAFTPENCVYQYQLAAPESEAYAKSFAYFENGIHAAADLGCRVMCVNSGWGYWNEAREEAWKRSREMLHRLAASAEQHGVTLAIETLRPEESQLVVTLADARRMFSEVNHPHLKIMIDTTAMGVAGETIQGWFDAFGENIIHMHFVDGNPYGHLVWGDGAHSLPDMVATLSRNCYTGYLGQEITDSRYFRDPLSADRRNMQNLEKYF